jgi:hypothetical protein
VRTVRKQDELSYSPSDTDRLSIFFLFEFKDLLFPRPLFTWRKSQWAGPSPLSRLHDLTQTHTLSVGLLWKSDQSNTETPTGQHAALARGTSVTSAGFKNEIPVSERRRGHRDRLSPQLQTAIYGDFSHSLLACVRLPWI